MEPNGSVKVNLFSKDDPHWADFEKFEGKPGKIYVGGHGTPHSISDDRQGEDKSVALSPVDVGKLVLAAGGTQEMPIDLHSCSVGKGHHSFARALSSYFPTVKGSTGDLVSIGAKNETEFNYLSSVDGNGRFKTFHSEDRVLAKIHPELVDTPESERPSSKYNKNGTQAARAQDYPAGEMPLPVTNRDLGDEKPITSPSDYSKKLDINHYSNMAAEYKTAINTPSFEEARSLAENKFGELKIVFLAREFIQKTPSILEEHRSAALKGFDGHAINMIEKDQISDLRPKTQEVQSNQSATPELSY